MLFVPIVLIIETQKKLLNKLNTNDHMLTHSFLKTVRIFQFFIVSKSILSRLKSTVYWGFGLYRTLKSAFGSRMSGVQVSSLRPKITDGVCHWLFFYFKEGRDLKRAIRRIATVRRDCCGARVRAEGRQSFGQVSSLRPKNLVLRNEIFLSKPTGLVYHHALACISSLRKQCISSRLWRVFLSA